MNLDFEKITGLKNMGNTCYLNSGLQLLLNCIFFNKLIIKNNYEDLFLNGYKQTLIDYYNKEVTQIGPRIISSHIFKNFTQFNHLEQSDSSEFIICLLELIENKILNLTFNLYSELNNKKLISILFTCEIKNCITCLETNETFYSNDSLKILTFSIPKKNNLKLEDCYNDFIKEEKLNGNYKYYNEKINKYVEAKKKIVIANLPKYLFINLNRFNNNLEKISEEILIDDKFKINNTDYKLIGFIVHIGNLNNGHYLSFLLKNEKWYLCNDNNINICESITKFVKHAYILLFLKY